MNRKKEARRCERRGHKSSYTGKNKPDLQKAQSPWGNVLHYDPLAELGQRSQADGDRLEATCVDDEAWFADHLGRQFHIRNATPHERETGLSCGWVLVAKYSGGRVRLSVPFPALAARDASRHDTEEKGRELFDWLTWGYTEEETHPFLFGVLQEIRGARHG
jgi:hypothetical protein